MGLYPSDSLRVLIRSPFCHCSKVFFYSSTLRGIDEDVAPRSGVWEAMWATENPFLGGEKSIGKWGVFPKGYFREKQARI